MMYLCLIPQVVLLLTTIFCPIRDNYISFFKHIVNRYLIYESIFQIIFIVINIIFAFVLPNSMLVVLILQIVAMGIINIVFEIIGKKAYYKKLKYILDCNNLYNMSTIAIRRYILEYHGLLYSEKHIDKVILQLTKDR